MELQEINGTYGSGKCKATIYTATLNNGATWYAVEGSTGVNKTFDEVEEGINVELLNDVDFFTNGNTPINSLEDLENAINS